ncbi:hypothetical protein KUCAC02_019889 [Chaenocephalus aceratus]|uniref:Uncharacterized protein n=1 Tax=Chaenocephalus aceratus TaxID=36190 RepID=A0ACB9VQI1_CHAAC|nr:hypothetical protein KUCAC02_019889 [Chaenocephalus aceratus]
MSSKSNSAESADISDGGNAVDEGSEGRPRSSISIKSAKSVKSNISGKSSKSKSSEVPNEEIGHKDGNDEEPTADKEAETRASSPMSDRSEKNSDDSDTTERAPSAISAKSSASAISTKSKASQALPEHNDDICDEGDAEEETSERSPSCMSEKSMMSNISARSNFVKDSHETPGTAESKSDMSKRITSPGPLENTDIGRSVKDNKSDKSSKRRHNTKMDDFELVPSNLPNASPTEVVNEWLNSIPAEGDMYDIEEVNGNCDEQNNGHTKEEINGMEMNGNCDSAAENTVDSNEGIVQNSIPNEDCQISMASPNADNTCTQRDDVSKIFNSSVQVMKVLLNPKLDRCNSLPEISTVYGRKLSASARGLLDCLVKLQLIVHNPENANEQDERYQELMNILQSLWLCDPPENEQVLKRKDKRYVDDDFNHTSSSGVDVNSGSTGSGNSSDGVNGNISQLHTSPGRLNKVQELCEDEAEGRSSVNV